MTYSSLFDSNCSLQLFTSQVWHLYVSSLLTSCLHLPLKTAPPLQPCSIHFLPSSGTRESSKSSTWKSKMELQVSLARSFTSEPVDHACRPVWRYFEDETWADSEGIRRHTRCGKRCVQRPSGWFGHLFIRDRSNDFLSLVSPT